MSSVLRMIFTAGFMLIPFCAKSSNILGEFSDYSVTPFTGKTKFPEFKGSQKEYRLYRTRIREGMLEGPNFAGKYSLIQIGCGTGCSFVYIANHTNGLVLELHQNEPKVYAFETYFKINSRLLLLQGQESSEMNQCAMTAYELTDGGIKFILSKRLPNLDYCNNDVQSNFKYITSME